MEDDERGFQPDGVVEGLDGVLEGQFALAGIGGGKQVDVWGGLVDADGQRAKVVEGGDADEARIHGIEDAIHQAEADAVAEFGKLETEIANLLQHHAAIGVAVRVPAG